MFPLSQETTYHEMTDSGLDILEAAPELAGLIEALEEALARGDRVRWWAFDDDGSGDMAGRVYRFEDPPRAVMVAGDQMEWLDAWDQ